MAYMIFTYLLAALIALAVYVFTSRLGMNTRVISTLLVFVILVASITILMVKIGDKPAPDSVIVYPEKVPDAKN